MKVCIELQPAELKGPQKVGLKLLLGLMGLGPGVLEVGKKEPQEAPDLGPWRPEGLKEAKDKPAQEAPKYLASTQHHTRVYLSGLKGRRLRAYVTAVLKNEDKPLGISEVARRVKLSYGGAANVLRELKKKRIIDISNVKPRLYFFRGGNYGK